MFMWGVDLRSQGSRLRTELLGLGFRDFLGRGFPFWSLGCLGLLGGKVGRGCDVSSCMMSFGFGAFRRFFVGTPTSGVPASRMNGFGLGLRA